MARVPNEVPRRYDQHITVFIRSTRGLQDNWLRHIVSRPTGTHDHMMIHNVEEIPEERNRLALDPGGDNDIVSIHTVTHSQGTIRWAKDAPAYIIRLDLSVSNFMHTFIRMMTNPYIEHRGQITYLQLHDLAHVTGSPNSRRLAVRSTEPADVMQIRRVVILDGMDIKRSMESTTPNVGLYSALHIIYDLSTNVADTLEAEIMLALPDLLKSTEIYLALAF